MLVSLIDFFSSGQFGQLRSGLHIKEIQNLLGEPQDVAYRKGKWPSIWKYQSLEIFLQKYQLVGMALYGRYALAGSDKVFSIPRQISIIPAIDQENMTRGELDSLLQQHGISYQIVAQSVPDNVEIWRTKSGVSINFVLDQEHIDSFVYHYPQPE